jgi:hypothetical protein
MRQRRQDHPTIQMSYAEHDIFVAWVKSTLGNGTGRFTMQVWLGTAYAVKVCQFVKPGSSLKYAWLSATDVAVTMTLRLYGI